MIKNLLFGGPGSPSPLGDFGILILRMSGLLMAIGHGISKVFADGRFGPPEQLVQGVEKMGFPAPTAFAWAAALAEMLGGFLVAAGLMTRPAAAALTFNMLVAAFVAHGKDPWFSMGGASKEFAVLYLVTFVAVMLLGPGRFSIDRFIARRSARSAKA